MVPLRGSTPAPIARDCLTWDLVGHLKCASHVTAV